MPVGGGAGWWMCVIDDQYSFLAMGHPSSTHLADAMACQFFDHASYQRRNPDPQKKLK
jgi:hypothetical protein